MIQMEWLLKRPEEGLSVVWADDLFFPPASYVSEDVLYPALPREKILDAARGDAPMREASKYLERIWAVHKLCERLGVGLALASFEGLEEALPAIDLERTLFLLDVEYRLSTRVWSCPADSPLYGYNFAHRLKLPLERIKFYTRWPQRVDDANTELGWNLSPEDNCIIPSVRTGKVEEWITTWEFDRDQWATEGIRFYGLPWRRGAERKWNHDDLADPNSEAIADLSNWLGVESEALTEHDGWSAKSLMMWRGDGVQAERASSLWAGWSRKGHRGAKQLSGRILNAAAKKLNISSGGLVDDKAFVAMPCDPCLPFLVALRSFLGRMERSKEPVQIQLCGFGEQWGVFVLDIESGLQGQGGTGWQLAEMYQDETLPSSSADPDTDHTSTRYLHEVTYCRTAGLHHRFRTTELPPNYDFIRLFKDGTPLPCVGLYFRPHHTYLLWTGLKTRGRQ